MIKKKLDSGCLKKISILEIQFWYSQLDLDLMTLTMLDLKKKLRCVQFLGEAAAFAELFGRHLAFLLQLQTPAANLKARLPPQGNSLGKSCACRDG